MIASDSAFKAAIYQALCSCLALSPDSDTAKSIIREAYTEPENSPRPARTVDVIYWSASPDSGIADPVQYVNDAQLSGFFKAGVMRALPYDLTIVCYGPGCVGNAHRIRSFFFLDGAGMPRRILRLAGIFPVPDPPAPTYLFEPEGSLWRNRADLSISVLVCDKAVYAPQQQAVSVPPSVTIIR